MWGLSVHGSIPPLPHMYLKTWYLRKFSDGSVFSSAWSILCLRHTRFEKKANRICVICNVGKWPLFTTEHLVDSKLLFLQEQVVETPQGVMYQGKRSASDKICGVSILRAGETMEQAVCDVCKDIRIGKILIQTNLSTGEPEVSFFFCHFLLQLLLFLFFS